MTFAAFTGACADAPEDGEPGADTGHTDAAVTALGGSLRCVLDDRGLLALRGSDAARFLQGQVSTDVLALAPGESSLTSYSDAKGRLLLVDRLYAESDGFLLSVPADRLEVIRQTLTRYVLRADVRIEDISDDVARIGVAGQNAAVALHELVGPLPERPGQSMEPSADLRLVRLLGRRPRWQIMGPHSAVEAIRARLADHTIERGADAWRLLDIEAGIPSVGTATAGRFVAQMLNLDRLGAVDFRKGCYPGQEVIARTHYLGRIKRRMQLLATQTCAEPPAPMTPIHSGEAVIGEVIDAATESASSALMLAVVRRDASEPLTLGAPDGPPLTHRPLPYTLDNEVA